MNIFRKDRGLWILFIVFVALAVLAGGYLAVLSSEGVPETTSGGFSVSSATVLEGTYVCLPRADKSATKECTPGIKVGEEYYALDLAPLLDAGVTTNFTNGTKILAAGAITPKEEVTDEQWKSYTIIGVMRVEEVAKN